MSAEKMELLNSRLDIKIDFENVEVVFEDVQEVWTTTEEELRPKDAEFAQALLNSGAFYSAAYFTANCIDKKNRL